MNPRASALLLTVLCLTGMTQRSQAPRVLSIWGILHLCTLLIRNPTFPRGLLPRVPESASSLPRPPSPLGQGFPSTRPHSPSLFIPGLTILAVNPCLPHPLGHVRGFFLLEYEGALPCTLWPHGRRGKLGRAGFQSAGIRPGKLLSRAHGDT